MAKKQIQPAKDTGLFDQMIGSATISGPAPKKNAKPVISLDKSNSANLVAFLAAKKKMKEAEGEMRLIEGPLLELCTKKQDDDASNSDYNGSYSLITEDKVTKATFISQDKFYVSNDEENVKELKSVLGSEFDNEVEKESSVTLKPEVFQDEKLKKELVNILGANFSKFFQTTVKYSMKSGFDERIYKFAKKPEDLIKLRALCGRAKPYIK